MKQALRSIFAISAICLPMIAGTAIADDAAEQELTAESARESIVGRWRHRDDVDSVVVYEADGITLDVYDGETLSTGTWEIVDDEGVVLLHVVMDGLDYDYEVAGVLDDYLWLIYLARGNSLHYNRAAD